MILVKFVRFVPAPIIVTVAVCLFLEQNDFILIAVSDWSGIFCQDVYHCFHLDFCQVVPRRCHFFNLLKVQLLSLFKPCFMFVHKIAKLKIHEVPSFFYVNVQSSQHIFLDVLDPFNHRQSVVLILLVLCELFMLSAKTNEARKAIRQLPNRDPPILLKGSMKLPPKLGH